MKTLIVDDCEADRTILRHYLNQFGSEILEAADGAEGFSISQSELPDLIISDALMPNMDGFEFLRKIRRSADLRNTPFIFYSAVYTGNKDKELALSLGADAFLVKPMEPEEFLLQLKIQLDLIKRTNKRELSELLEEDEKYLRKYSHIVATRLEEKVRELELANRKLAGSEARYHNLFNSMRDVIIISDQDRYIIDTNQPAMREIFGYETDEIAGKRCNFLYGSSDALKMTGNEFINPQESNDGKVREICYRRKNGDQFTGELIAMKLLDDAGKPVGNVNVIRDVTELRKVEAQLLQSQKMESIGTLAGGIAHDFNNILTAIIGYANLTLIKMAENDLQRPKIQNILNASDRAVHLTKELLLFSRKQALDRKPVDLNRVVTTVETFLKRIIREDITITTITHEAELPVLADVYQLEQVLMNLATNSCDSMPQGGSIAVSTGIVHLNEEFHLTNGFGKLGTYAQLTVSDTGVGMNEDTQKRIFEPFYTTKDVGKGTGLGLAVAYSIIKQHDGNIAVSSEPAQGTTFKIYLPLIAMKTWEDFTLPQVEKPSNGTETILLAEDNEMVRNLVKTVLSESGYTVIEAVDGQDAILKFKEHAGAVQLMLFDMIMPKMNGKEASDEIHKIEPGIKTIFASGYAPEIVHLNIANNPDIHLIHKPISPQDLLMKVREVLDEH